MSNVYAKPAKMISLPLYAWKQKTLCHKWHNATMLLSIGCKRYVFGAQEQDVLNFCYWKLTKSKQMPAKFTVKELANILQTKDKMSVKKALTNLQKSTYVFTNIFGENLRTKLVNIEHFGTGHKQYYIVTPNENFTTLKMFSMNFDTYLSLRSGILRKAYEVIMQHQNKKLITLAPEKLYRWFSINCKRQTNNKAVAINVLKKLVEAKLIESYSISDKMFNLVFMEQTYDAGLNISDSVDVLGVALPEASTEDRRKPAVNRTVSAVSEKENRRDPRCNCTTSKEVDIFEEFSNVEEAGALPPEKSFSPDEAAALSAKLLDVESSLDTDVYQIRSGMPLAKPENWLCSATFFVMPHVWQHQYILQDPRSQALIYKKMDWYLETFYDSETMAKNNIDNSQLKTHLRSLSYSGITIVQVVDALDKMHENHKRKKNKGEKIEHLVRFCQNAIIGYAKKGWNIETKEQQQYKQTQLELNASSDREIAYTRQQRQEEQDKVALMLANTKMVEKAWKEFGHAIDYEELSSKLKKMSNIPIVQSNCFVPIFLDYLGSLNGYKIAGGMSLTVSLFKAIAKRYVPPERIKNG